MKDILMAPFVEEMKKATANMYRLGWDERNGGNISYMLEEEQVAEYLGMKQPQYSRYERGLRDIPSDVLIRLAQLYKTSTDYILGLVNTSKPYNK